MGSITEQVIPFMQGFPDQPELTIFQVTDPSMQHVGRCHTGARTEISPLHDQAVHPLEGKIPKGAYPIDPRSDDQDSCVGIVFDFLNNFGSILHLCLLFFY